MVVRLDSAYRKDITDVETLFVPLPNGGQIPLQQVAEVIYKLGPAQISREDGKRRIVVGLNVKDRDVQSVVEDMQKKIEADVKLPIGYYVTYGGQFENLKEATQRLTIAVPVALLMILILLYLTFSSMKQALLIFTAIPLSAIGGVIALWMRDMPFSISAGIGFIALFGVAVLNGIVLISTFNQLAKEGVHDIYERVRQGTMIRLRPVLMTASVASLGFLPMALSNSAGAEVQRPLATVVIGGLISATALTLIVLPALYILFNRKRKRKIPVAAIVTFFAINGLFISEKISAQNVVQLPLDSVVNIALRNNPQIKAAELEIIRNQHVKLTKKEEIANGTMAFHFKKPAELTFRAGQFCDITLINPSETDAEGNVRGFSLANAPFQDDIIVATRMRDTAFKLRSYKVLAAVPSGQ